MGGSDQLTGIIVINRTTDTIGTTGKVYPASVWGFQDFGSTATR